MELERKAFGASVEAGEQGMISALVSVSGNIDRTKEVVMPGAFKASLGRRLPKGVWAHDWQQPIAKTLEATETDKGLVIKGQFNLETQRGREAYSDIKFGIIDEFSIGYRVVKESFNEEKDARSLDELELFEWSPVLVGMNPDTQLLSIKSDVPATFANQAERVLACLEQLATRAKSLAELRAKEGRVISATNRGRISACVSSMRSVADDLDALLAMSEPVAKASELDAAVLYAEHLKLMTAEAARR